MYTVSDVARLFDVSKQSGRVWAGEFAQHLDPDANPPPGKTRQFTEDDMEVFALVAQLRQEGANYEDIHAALAAGERGNVEQVQAATQEQDAAPVMGLVPLSAVQEFTQQLTRQYESQVTAVTEERDNLREQLTAERQARIEAEKRATAAETRLQVISEREGEKDAARPGTAAQGERRAGLWERLRGR